MTQIELIQKIISLAAENPEAEIKICVDNELVDEFGWTNHKIRKVELSTWIVLSERIYTDECTAKDEISDLLWCDANKNQTEFDRLVDEYFKEHSADAICVFTEVA